MTSALGRADALLALLCQPAEVQGFVPLPASVGFWGIDSGIRHAVSGSDYTSVRTGAFMGYRIIAERAGLRAPAASGDGVVRVDDPRWSGYLANLSPGRVRPRIRRAAPRDHARRRVPREYGGTTDRVTRVDPGRTYAVRQPTAHPIHEHARVRRFAELLAGDPDDAALGEMGELMYASHASYSACGLGSDGTDLLVELVRQAGPGRGPLRGQDHRRRQRRDRRHPGPGRRRSRPSPRSPARYQEQTGRAAVRLLGLVAGCMPVRRPSHDPVNRRHLQNDLDHGAKRWKTN